MIRSGAILLVGIVALGGCVQSADEPDAPTPIPGETVFIPPEETGPARPARTVPWEDYAPSVKESIDGFLEQKDCAGLQQQFDAADASNQATIMRTGHNNADLMAYIDEAMKMSDCQ